MSIIGLPRPTVHREIERLGKGFDAVVIDSPPRVYEAARSAIIEELSLAEFAA